MSPPTLLLDHRDGRPAVLGQCLEVPAPRQRQRDERVPGCVELPGPDVQPAEGRAPRPLREDLDVDRAAIGVQEHEVIGLDVQRLLALQDFDDERRQLYRPFAARRFRSIVLAERA